VERGCGVLNLDGFEPRVLTRRLIKMAMYAEITIHREKRAQYTRAH
jgi:hypothetical protein